MDIIGLTNFTQMKIEIAVYNQHTNMVEEIQTYAPDQSFPCKLEDTNVPKPNQYPDMKLFNYKNTHFDLIVEKGHPLLGQFLTNKAGHDNSQEGSGCLEAEENRQKVLETEVERESEKVYTEKDKCQGSGNIQNGKWKISIWL